MTERAAPVRRASVIAAIALSACVQAPDVSTDAELDLESDAELGATSQPIINGRLQPSDEFAAVGALVYTFPEVGVLDTWCSGTLVAKKAIVTARHCTPSIDLALESGLVPAFAIGADAFNPTQIIPITGYVNAPPSPDGDGLLLDGGRDVAVAYLESRPVGVKPVKLGRFDPHMLGERFTIAGYGVNNPERFYGQRHAGKVTARALHGRWYKLLFGDYDTFLEWYFTDSTSPAPSQAEADEWWSIYRLESKFELLAGGLPGEALGCYGDSGGPLLRGKRARDLTTYGVNFAVEGTLSTACGHGGAYLVFNRKMLDFVRDAL